MSACQRKEWYRVQKKKVTNPRPPEEFWKLKSYGLFEYYITEPLTAEYQGNVTTQFALEWGKWRARVDARVEDSGHVTFVEAKSISPAGLKYNLPNEHNVAQAQAYYVIAKETEVQCDSVLLVYIERWTERYKADYLPRLGNSCYDKGYVSEPEVGIPAMVTFDITPSEKELATVRQNMTALANVITGEKMPERPYPTDDHHPWDCTAYNKDLGYREVRCPYYSLCWTN
jgi:hypothetical protein